MMRWTSLALLVALALGCGGDDDQPIIPQTDGGNGGVTASFNSLYGDYFQRCTGCHTPDGPGRTTETEQTLDFSTKDTAYTTITTGSASGLVGNQEGCNGVPFVSGDPSSSLIVAVMDGAVRQSLDLPDHMDCNTDSVSDMTVKAAESPSGEFLSSLKQWITDGAPNN